MEPVAVVFFVVMGGVIVAIILWGASMSRNIDENLAAAAARFGGHVTPGGFWKHATFELSVDGVRGVMTYWLGSKNSPPYTRLQFAWTPPGNLRITPEGLFQKLGKFFGSADLQIGDPAFDGAYLIQGAPEAWVRGVLDAKTRGSIASLERLGKSMWGRTYVRFEAGPGGVTVRCSRCFVSNREELFQFIDTASTLQRRLRGGAASPAPAVSIHDVVAKGGCPVCGEGLSKPVHCCARCGAAYHEDCWMYNGDCAIYDCALMGRASRLT